MALPRVAAFTDTYLPTVNGVTYTVKTWREQWARRDSEMAVVYPKSEHTAISLSRRAHCSRQVLTV